MNRDGKVCTICGNPLGKVKGYLDGLKVRADISQCRTCRFWDNHNKLCDYLNVTGKLRRCEPSPNCTKYERGKKKNEKRNDCM